MAVSYQRFDGKLASSEWSVSLSAARADGVKFHLNSGHRSIDEQRELFEQNMFGGHPAEGDDGPWRHARTAVGRSLQRGDSTSRDHHAQACCGLPGAGRPRVRLAAVQGQDPGVAPSLRALLRPRLHPVDMGAQLPGLRQVAREGRPVRAGAQPGGAREYAWLSAVFYWTTHGLNGYADSGDFRGLTKAINGGFNGLSDREDRHRRCLELGDAILPEDPDPLLELTPKERNMAQRLLFHRHRMDREAKTGKGPLYRRERLHAASWKATCRAQMLALKADARIPGRGGWTKDNRGKRYQILKAVVERRIK